MLHKLWDFTIDFNDGIWIFLMLWKLRIGLSAALVWFILQQGSTLVWIHWSVLIYRPKGHPWQFCQALTLCTFSKWLESPENGQNLWILAPTSPFWEAAWVLPTFFLSELQPRNSFQLGNKDNHKAALIVSFLSGISVIFA